MVPKNIDDDEEYKLPDEFGESEHPPELPPEEEPEKPKRKKFTRRNVILAIVVLGAILAIYQFLTQPDRSSPTQPKLTEATSIPTPVKTPTPTKPPAQPEATATSTLPTTLLPPPVITTATVAPPVTPPGPAMLSPPSQIPQPPPEAQPLTTLLPPSQLVVTPPQVATLRAQAARTPISSQAEELQAGTVQAGQNQSVMALQAHVSSLSNQLQMLTQQMEILACNPGALCPKAKKEALIPEKQYSVKKRRRVVAQQVYHVKAVIPGRAWLESNFGNTTSVKVGDSLKNYGYIVSINTNTGNVDTSSGRVIKYGPNDS